MYSFIITLLLMAGTAYAVHALAWGETLMIILSLVVGIASQVVIGLIVRKKIMLVMSALQTQMQTAGEQLKRKYETLAQRGGNIKLLMEQSQKEQSLIFQDALAYLVHLDPFKKWALFFTKQINTLKVQFYFQMKKFNEVDALMDKMTIAEPMAACMCMSRYYQLGQRDKLNKIYKKYSKRFKTKAELIYATMSWIHVKENKIDDAIAVLIEGKKVTASEMLSQNYDALINGKINKFSNLGYGDMWYALYLEEPKIPKSSGHQVAMQPQHRQFMSGGGKAMRRH